MKAIRIHAYGPPEALVYEDVPDPVAKDDEVVVAVQAMGVNPADYKFRNGSLAASIRHMPFTPGMDIVGHVDSVGGAVTHLRIGDHVLAMLYMMGNGGYAERVALPAAWCAPMPPGLDAVHAATLPTPATTAVELIEDGLDVQPGQNIMVTGATGAVGRIACYAARRRGAHVTAAVRARYADKVDYADDMLALDSRPMSRQGWYDGIADTIGGASAERLLPALREGGRLSTISTDPVTNPEGLDVIVERFGNRADAHRLGQLAADLASGKLRIATPDVMKLSEAAHAHRIFEGGGSGKIVLIPD